ncbi:MAG: FAD-dependent oxidoreductase [Alphaproteobacteria bacterium]|nr:FAD-dependent oxidoreductase [Alphaproteobacteria bacterium]
MARAATSAQEAPVNVLVLGAGIIGTATAYCLACEGHAVTVVDRQDAPAEETSRANAGLLVPSQSPPWNAPGIPWQALKWLRDDQGSLILRPRWEPWMWRWLLRFAWQSQPRHYRRNALNTLKLARLSKARLAALRQAEGLAYAETTGGILSLVRNPAALPAYARHAAFLRDLGLDVQYLDPAACVALEPALAPLGQRIAGGFHSRDDESGDAHALARGLAERATARGARFQFGTTVLGLVAERGRIASVATRAGALRADRYVLALGAESRALARGVGLALPIYPIKGYSVTVDIAGWAGAPRMPIRDPDLMTAATPLGTRLRVAGMAELTGIDRRIEPRYPERLVRALRALFPNLPSGARVEPWAGLRPMTPDGPPILGPTHYDNLLLNVGHGALGWTLAMGSAQVIADLVAGRRPSVALDGLTLAGR